MDLLHGVLPRSYQVRRANAKEHIQEASRAGIKEIREVRIPEYFYNFSVSFT